MSSKTILIILSYTVFSWCIFGTQCTYLLTVTYHFRRKMFLCRVLQYALYLIVWICDILFHTDRHYTINSTKVVICLLLYWLDTWMDRYGH